MIKSAEISNCGNYRYSLSRVWNEELPKCCFWGINPSIADSNIDDATVRKMIGFSSRMSYGGFYLGNIFPYRSTDVKGLSVAENPYGEPSKFPIPDQKFLDAVIHIAAWGNSSKIPKSLRFRIQEFVDYFDNEEINLYSIGITKSGDPRHPLMTSYSTPCELWKH